MKIIESIIESIIIVLGFIFIVIPEILYSLVLELRDCFLDTIRGL